MNMAIRSARVNHHADELAQLLNRLVERVETYEAVGQDVLGHIIKWRRVWAQVAADERLDEAIEAWEADRDQP